MSSLLCASVAFCALAGCGTSEKKSDAPDYSQSTVRFDRWAYTAVYDGWWQTVLPDGTKVRLENSAETPIAITSKESLQEYKDCGMNVLLINYIYSVDGPSFKGSKTERIMDWAHELDMKCMLFEGTVRAFSQYEESVINPDKADGKKFFNTQEEFKNFLYEQVKDVVAHPAFLGFTLRDEPSYKMLPAMGQTYKALLSIAPNSHNMINLLPMYNGKSVIPHYCEGALEMPLHEAYGRYLQTYLDCTGADYIQYDSYPLLGDDTWQTLDEDYVWNMQIVAEFAKKNNLRFDHVFQSCSWRGTGKNGQTTAGARKPSEADMRWQMNIGMAMGIKGYAYWNYYPVVNTDGEHHDLTSSFLNRDGSQNAMYGWMKKFHGEMQVTEKALANFDYVTSQVTACEPVPGLTTHIQGVTQGEFSLLQSDLKSPGILLVSELYDDEKDLTGYYICNATDSLEKSSLEVSLTFEGYDMVQYYFRGNVEEIALENGEVTLQLPTAQGGFVIPYKITERK